MKYKVIKDKKNGDCRIDYYKMTDKNTFRFEILKKVFLDKEIIIKIDSNLVKPGELGETDMEISRQFERILTENNFIYEVIPIEKNKNKRILGIKIRADKENAYMILFKINGNDLSKELFNKYLANCDLDIGLEPVKSFEEIYKDLQKGYVCSFFDSGFFQANIYDSNLIGTMRLSKELTPPLF